MKRKYIYQAFKNECGFTCLKNLLYFLSDNEDYLYLANLKIDREYTFEDLIIFAKDYNLNLKGFYIDDLSFLKCPSIGLIKSHEFSHYIFIEKRSKDYIYFFDPVIGYQKLKIDSFKKIALGYYLLIEKHSLINQNIKNPKLEFNFKNYYLYQFISCFIQFVFIFLLSLSIGNLNYQFCLIVVIYGIYLLLNKVILLKFSHIYDDKIIYKDIEKNENNKYVNELIENDYLLKQALFSKANSSLTSFVYIGFIFFILLVNNLYNFIPLIILIIGSYLRHYLFKIKLRKVNQTESYFLNDNHLLNKQKSHDKKIYKIINIDNYVYGTLILIIAVINLVICYYLKSTLSFIYFVFLEKIFLDKLGEIYSHQELKKKADILKVKRNSYLKNQ